ncbi:MAG: hypothetical protein LBT50_05015 [Prevotellaceae bacterium]|jgi:hypothetical protein|nr:hypothetical protein [Prevotellaceae bacterium]
MDTITVEIKDKTAFGFLQYMENMNMIKIIKDNNKPASADKKLSERFAGCLSSERAEELQKELVQMRNEWERDIF